MRNTRDCYTVSAMRRDREYQLADLPRGMQSTRENMRALWRRKFWLFFPFVAAVVGMAGLVAFFVYSLGYGFGLPTFAADTIDTSLWPPLLLFAPYIIILIVAVIGEFIYRPITSRNRFAHYVNTSVSTLSDPEAMKFQDALDAMSIAAGMEPPNLIFLTDMNRSNAMAFIDDEGCPTVGVTTGMLNAALPVDEATAVMAHEVAHLQLGINVQPPQQFHAEYVPNLLVLLYIFIPLSLFFVRMSAGGRLALVGIYLVVLACLIGLRFSSRYNVRLADLLYFHGDMLADSVAVKLVRDPDSIRRAIERVDRLNQGQGYDVQQVYFAKYQFLPPGTTIGDYYRFAGSLFGYRVGSEKFYIEKMAMLDQVEVEKKFFQRRMNNLHIITQGKVHTVADWAAGD